MVLRELRRLNLSEEMRMRSQVHRAESYGSERDLVRAAVTREGPPPEVRSLR